MELMRKSYSGESLVDIERDVSEAVQEDYNHLISQIPKDEYGFQRGVFTVVIEWKE